MSMDRTIHHMPLLFPSSHITEAKVRVVSSVMFHCAGRGEDTETPISEDKTGHLRAVLQKRPAQMWGNGKWEMGNA